DRLENARIELARELQRDLVLAQRSEHVEQVARVEADRHRVARVVDVELLAALADLRALADDAQRARLHHEADAAALVARDEADAPQRLHQALPRADDAPLLLLGDDLRVGRKLLVGELDAEEHVVAPEERVATGGGDADLRTLALGLLLLALQVVDELLELADALVRHEHAEVQHRAVEALLGLAEAVPVGRDHADDLAVTLEERAGEVGPRVVGAHREVGTRDQVTDGVGFDLDELGAACAWQRREVVEIGRAHV